MTEDKKLKELDWLGDSKAVVRSFDDDARQDIGYAIFQLQEGQKPDASTRNLEGLPKKVWEIRIQDESFWYRVAYVTFVKGKVVIVHAFKKKSAKTSQGDLNIIKQRLKEIEQ